MSDLAVVLEEFKTQIVKYNEVDIYVNKESAVSFIKNLKTKCANIQTEIPSGEMSEIYKSLVEFFLVFVATTVRGIFLKQFSGEGVDEYIGKQTEYAMGILKNLHDFKEKASKGNIAGLLEKLKGALGNITELQGEVDENNIIKVINNKFGPNSEAMRKRREEEQRAIKQIIYNCTIEIKNLLNNYNQSDKPEITNIKKIITDLDYLVITKEYPEIIKFKNIINTSENSEKENINRIYKDK